MAGRAFIQGDTFDFRNRTNYLGPLLGGLLFGLLVALDGFVPHFVTLVLVLSLLLLCVVVFFRYRSQSF